MPSTSPDLQRLLISVLQILVLLGPLLVLQRSMHREVQSVLLMLTRRLDLTLALFSLLFFPGVLLHETSHWIVARLLGVRTGRFSLIPRPLDNGRLRLGYVETAAADWVRDTLIGAAPLLVGGAFVAFAGLAQLGIDNLWLQLVAAGPAGALQALPSLYARPDFWLWFYLVFAVSSTMLPSPSDRRAWLPMSLVIVLLFGLSLLAGAGPWLLAYLAEPFHRAMQAAAVVFAISALIHALLLLPVWMVRRLLSRLTGLQVVG